MKVETKEEAVALLIKALDAKAPNSGWTALDVLSRQIRTGRSEETKHMFRVATYQYLRSAPVRVVAKEFRRVISFSYDAKLDAGDEITKALRARKDELPRNSELRAQAVRWLGINGCLTSSQIKREFEVKKQFPWYWIDAVYGVDHELAIMEIRSQLFYGNLSPFLIRLSQYHGCGEQRFKEIVFKALQGTQLDTWTLVEKWFEQRNLKLYEKH